MQRTKLMAIVLLPGLISADCTKPAEKVQEETQGAAVTNPEIQSVIYELVLVYVEECSFYIISPSQLEYFIPNLNFLEIPES
jgi:hypothetical protein